MPVAPPLMRAATAIRSACVAASVALAVLGLVPLRARAADLQWHGLLDLIAAEQSRAFPANVLTRGDNPYDAYRLRLFAESQVDDRLQVLGQFVFDDVSEAYVDGAYVVATPWPDRDLHLLAGKLPWAIGTYGPRTYSDKNPLIATPLMYQYHSTLLWYQLPPNADALLAIAGTGSSGVQYTAYQMGVGMPLVDDSYWDTGVTLAGSARPLEFALGVTSGAPGWGSTARDDNSGKTVLGRLGWTPTPALRIGVSGAYGPYLAGSLASALPTGHDVNDYAQRLVMADLELLIAHAELRAEGARNVWETPTVGDLEVRSGYAELKYLLPSGLYLAARWDVERFGDLADSTGAQRPWDWDVTRLDGGVGYRITRTTTAKVVLQRTTFDSGVPGASKRNLSMLAGQLSFGF